MRVRSYTEPGKLTPMILRRVMVSEHGALLIMENDAGQRVDIDLDRAETDVLRFKLNEER